MDARASFTRATLNDTTGLLAATATSVSQQIAGPSGGAGVTQAFAGAEVTNRSNGRSIFARTITVTTGAHAATYKTGAGNALVATGLVLGVTTTENLLLTQANGGETIFGLTLWDDPTQVSITIPGQNDALGTIAFGVADIGAPWDGRFGSGRGPLCGFKAHAAGSVLVASQAGKLDLIVVPATEVGLVGDELFFERIVASRAGLSTSAIGLTVYRGP